MIPLLMVSFSKKLGNTPDAIMKGKKLGKVKGSPEKKGKKKNPWSDSDVSDVEGQFLLYSMLPFLTRCVKSFNKPSQAAIYQM